MADVQAVCPKCGNKTFVSPRPKTEPNDVLTCDRCHHQIMQRDLVAQSAMKIAEQVPSPTSTRSSSNSSI